MSGLSKQSIRNLCVPLPGADALPHIPMIVPFEPNKVRTYGVSHGLSHASYDATIAHDLVLGRHPGYVIKEWELEQDYSTWRGRLRALWCRYTGELQQRLRDEPPAYALAFTVEDFCMPANVRGEVCDKSTFARVFVSAYNTFFDPGFHGNATLELVNDSDKRVEYKAGQGVCQFVFTWLDEATEDPYSGKYQGQTKQAHGARFEVDSPKCTDQDGADWNGGRA